MIIVLYYIVWLNLIKKLIHSACNRLKYNTRSISLSKSVSNIYILKVRTDSESTFKMCQLQVNFLIG